MNVVPATGLLPGTGTASCGSGGSSGASVRMLDPGTAATL
jgi:hypothetical protein